MGVQGQNPSKDIALAMLKKGLNAICAATAESFFGGMEYIVRIDQKPKHIQLVGHAKEQLAMAFIKAIQSDFSGENGTEEAIASFEAYTEKFEIYIPMHQCESEKQVTAYLERLREICDVFSEQAVEIVKEQYQKNIRTVDSPGLSHRRRPLGPIGI